MIIDKLRKHWLICQEFRFGNRSFAERYFLLQKRHPNTPPIVRKAIKNTGI